jgi:hypothetical protein
MRHEGDFRPFNFTKLHGGSRLAVAVALNVGTPSKLAKVFVVLFGLSKQFLDSALQCPLRTASRPSGLPSCRKQLSVVGSAADVTRRTADR